MSAATLLCRVDVPIKKAPCRHVRVGSPKGVTMLLMCKANNNAERGGGQFRSLLSFAVWMSRLRRLHAGMIVWEAQKGVTMLIRHSTNNSRQGGGG